MAGFLTRTHQILDLEELLLYQILFLYNKTQLQIFKCTPISLVNKI
jgi:hypothetical protein